MASLFSSIIPIIASPEVEPQTLVIDGKGKGVHLTNVDGWDSVIVQNAPDTIIENLVYTNA